MNTIKTLCCIITLLTLALFTGCVQEKPFNYEETYVIDERQGIPMETTVISDAGNQLNKEKQFTEWKENQEAESEYQERTRHKEDDHRWDE